MARDIQAYNGIVTAPTSDYPNGRIKSDTGINNGTDCDEQSNGDIQQFFAKMMREGDVAYSNLPDNEYSGNQFFEALRKSCRPYFSYVTTLTQSGTVAPASTERENELGVVTWSRISTGFYAATFSTALPNAGIVLISNSLFGYCLTSSVNTGATVINVKTTDLTGSLSDAILNGTAMEVRCYKP